MDDYRAYYRALAGVAKRPVFIQTTGGAPRITPTVEMMVELAREYPQLGYVKEEAAPAVVRMQSLMSQRPVIHRVFSGDDGLWLTYEMRLGADGTMPLAPWSDLLVQTWDRYQRGHRAKARDIFSRFVLIENIARRIHGVPEYIMKKRGVFKTTVTRGQDVQLTPDEIAEIEFTLEGLRPYLTA